MILACPLPLPPCDFVPRAAVSRPRHAASSRPRMAIGALPRAVPLPGQIPFGRLLMEHVRERCVLLRACWRIHLGAALVAEFAAPALRQPSELSAAASAPPAPPAPAPPVCHAGTEEEDEENVAYGRTVSIVCDGLVMLPAHTRTRARAHRFCARLRAMVAQAHTHTAIVNAIACVSDHECMCMKL